MNKNRLEKIENFGNKLYIIVCIVLLLGLITIKSFYKTGYFPSTFDNALEKTDYKYDNIFENLAYIFLILTIIYILNKILLKTKLKYVIPIIFTIILVCFIVFVIKLDLIPIADQGQMMILAEAAANNTINLHVSPGSYLDMFPYQFGFAYYAGLVIRIIELTNNFLKEDIYIYLEILNTFYSIVCMALMYLIGNRIINNKNDKENNDIDINENTKKNRSNILLILIVIFSTYFMFFNTHVYGNLPGLMFGLLSLLCIIRFIQDKKLYNIIISAISIFIAIYLKTNYQIFLIAILCTLGLEFIKKVNVKSIISVLILLVMYFSLSTFGDWFMQRHIARSIPAGVPMITYIYMGWAPGNTLSSGWYTGDVINIYTNNNFDHIKTAENTKELFKKRIDHFINDMVEFRRYAWDKFDSTWLNPTFQTIWLATPGSDRINGNDEYKEYINENSWIKEMVNYNSDAFHIEERLFDAFEIIVFGFAIIGVLNLRKENNAENLLVLITFIGGAVFHFVVWETKAIYVLGYYFLLIPYTTIGINIAFEFINKKVKVLFDKTKTKCKEK